MQYDPIKRKLGLVFNAAPFLRKLFCRLLDVLLLRSWHIRKELKTWEKKYRGKRAILDAGSGFGQYDYYMATRHANWKITGVDVMEHIEKDEKVLKNYYTKCFLSFLCHLAVLLSYNISFCIDIELVRFDRS